MSLPSVDRTEQPLLLLPLAHAIAPFLHPRLPLRLKLLRLVLLLGCQDPEDLAPHPRLLQRHLGLRLGHRLRGRANEILIRGNRLHGSPLRVECLAELVGRCTHLVTMALADLTHLLALSVRQAELT